MLVILIKSWILRLEIPAGVIVEGAVGQLSQLVATGTCVHVERELKVPPVEAKQRVELIGVRMILDLGTVDPAKYPLPQTRLTLESLRDYVHLRPRTNTF
ncbi:asparagine--tRNA ligase, cytoplasmic 1-like [Rhododendron vialii]|uniref:asparagine--tRNA ligase, cytoplasmic 1-like n=1 Tax=Rhododendron vialii TaxID=182163 RepID=UPI00265EBBFC|nr:asparagine--tRNA ligase, cytoplasmic 1-like [Rhododendron vialii]